MINEDKLISLLTSSDWDDYRLGREIMEKEGIDDGWLNMEKINKLCPLDVHMQMLRLGGHRILIRMTKDNGTDWET